VLRHRRSRRYFKDGGWTNNAEEANDFHNAREVAEICLQHHLEEVDLVLHSAAGVVEITIRLR
jgi:hypothetical protein